MANKKNTSPSLSTSVVIQYQNLEFSETECIKKATAGFKKDHKGIELKSINVYIKPEDHKIYYVANDNQTGYVNL